MKKIIFLAAGALLASGMSAKVVLPKFFTDNMVVQQNSTLTVPGTAASGAKVSVKADWDGGEATTKADKEGRFSLSLPTPAAGGPFTVVLSDGTGDDLVLSNVLSGEVWLCSGQSNMEMPVEGWGGMGKIMNSDVVVATAQHPDIRLLQLTKKIALSPKDDAEVSNGGWVMYSPATMSSSAIAYLYALRLHEELGVPVGVIDSSWGGTYAEAWTGYDYLQDVPGFEMTLEALRNVGFDDGGVDKLIAELHESYMRANGLDKPGFDAAKMQSGKGWGSMEVPGYWENSVLPGYDGGVWMQRKVVLPESAAGKDLVLNLGTIDDCDCTYFNGVKVGGMGDCMHKRSYTVPGNLVKAGDNVVTVCVVDNGGLGGICGDASELNVQADGQTYPLAGEWGYMAQNLDEPLKPMPDVSWPNHISTSIYNAMINPLRVMPVHGVIWYQGCSNVGRPEQYEPLFQALIRNWRALWKNDKMPFYFVQLAGFMQPINVQPDSNWALLRNSQAKALTLPNTGMAVAIDLGNPVDIHPTNKQEVARRLSLIALNRDYGKDCVYEAPVCVSSKVEGNKMVLKFNGTVKPTSSALTGFIIGDKDGKFAYANARLEGTDTIVLSSPLVSKPAAARYNWADYPGGNLYGVTGLPVAPFATDK